MSLKCLNQCLWLSPAVTDKQALEENLYFEIKMDSQTKEYHIGTPIAVDSFLQHQRQNSGSSMKHSLSPPAHEDIGLSYRGLLIYFNILPTQMCLMICKIFLYFNRYLLTNVNFAIWHAM